MNGNRDVILFLCHYTTQSIVNEFRKIRKGSEHFARTYFAYNVRNRHRMGKTEDSNIFLFSNDDFLSLHCPVPENSIVPGYSCLPLLLFAQNNPEYAYYWSIEYDVRFSGDWKLFFDFFKDIEADFVGSHLRDYTEEPEWGYWTLTHPTEFIPLPERKRCFHPIYRISKSGLDCLTLSYQGGWLGHSEVLMPTLLHHSGFSLVDFGGNGRFIVPGTKNLFYTGSASNRQGGLNKGTMRYYPPFAGVGFQSNKLYHPIKPVLYTIRKNIQFYLGQCKRFLLGARAVFSDHSCIEKRSRNALFRCLHLRRRNQK